MKIYINGTYHDKDSARVSVFDHGLLYGDGVFEGIRFYNGRVFKLEEHLQRLEESARYLMLRMPWPRAAIRDATLQTVRENGLRDGYIRLVVTRGSGPLGLNPFTCTDPQLIIIADKIALYPGKLYETGMAIVTVPTQRMNNATLSPRVKSLNYLNNILAKIEAINAGVEEAVMLNSLGFVAECTGDNLFTVRGGTLATPPVNMGALEGITRNTVMELARGMGLSVEEQMMTRHDLFCADECFLTGTAAEVIPVTRIDGRDIGAGAPGQTTVKLMKAFMDLTRTTGTPVYEKA